jgi:hypothetical protein
MKVKTITNKGTQYNDHGYIQSEGVAVCDLGSTVTIGATEHKKSDLIMTDGKIESKTANWSVQW